MGTPGLPTGEPFAGRFVRLDPLTRADLRSLFPILEEPEIYASGYVMHRRPTSVADGVALAEERFLSGHGQADGAGQGRTAYAFRDTVVFSILRPEWPTVKAALRARLRG